MAQHHPVRHTAHTIRGPEGSSTAGPSGRVRMACPYPIQHTPHTCRGPKWSSIGPSGRFRKAHPTDVGTPLTPPHLRRFSCLAVPAVSYGWSLRAG
eukprot:9466615-Pyramimonas_sp.AAC.1